jgi:hypothetical protein
MPAYLGSWKYLSTSSSTGLAALSSCPLNVRPRELASNEGAAIDCWTSVTETKAAARDSRIVKRWKSGRRTSAKARTWYKIKRSNLVGLLQRKHYVAEKMLRIKRKTVGLRVVDSIWQVVVCFLTCDVSTLLWRQVQLVMTQHGVGELQCSVVTARSTQDGRSEGM